MRPTLKLKLPDDKIAELKAKAPRLDPPPEVTAAPASESETKTKPSTGSQETATSDSTKPKKKQLISRDKLLEVITWLSTTYPNAFNVKEPKPLKQHIHEDVLATSELPFSKVQIRKTLLVYTRNPRYVDSIINATHRVDLQGEPVQEIPESEKDYSRTLLAEIKKKLSTKAGDKRRKKRFKKKDSSANTTPKEEVPTN